MKHLLAPCILAALALSAAVLGAPPEPESKPQSPAMERLEAAAVRKLNAARTERSLPPLKECAALTAFARRFSRQMAERGFFSHTDPDGRTLADRIKATGIEYRTVGENIYKCEGLTDAGEAAANAWLKSP